MRDDSYLWDKSGAADPDIVQLERALGPYVAPPYRPLRTRRSIGWPLAIAAAVVLSAMLWRLSRPAASIWQLDSGRTLALGEVVRTGPGQHARLEASAVGSLRLEPNSALQIVNAQPGQQRLVLTRGTLHALIWAPSQSFAVETPAGTSIDLGCAYTLAVDDQGAGLVTVSAGWVAFQAGQRESFIPAGAACRTRRGAGPSLPYFTDAPNAFLESLSRWESNQELDGLLQAARAKDALTLWHLLQRTKGGPRRRQVARRLAALVPPMDAAALERGDPAALNQAWDALGLGSTGWWRAWKHPWSG